MSAYIPEQLRTRVSAADRNQCAYCQTREENSGIPLTIDHLLPRAKGGETIFENLCLACRPCNEYKADLMEAVDPLTGERTALFNPRTQFWTEHFEWSPDGLHIAGLTAIGRATVVALRMNNPTIVAARTRWVMVGWHPPISN